jgi:hypothetical protein
VYREEGNRRAPICDSRLLDARSLLDRLLASYIDMARRRFADRPDDLFQRNAQGLQEARSFVAALPEDSALLTDLQAWIDTAGIDEWEPVLLDGGWWSNLYHRCTRFCAFGLDESEEFIDWVIQFYRNLPGSVTDSSDAMRPILPAQARAARYVHFDGPPDSPPSVVGVLEVSANHQRRFRQFGLDPTGQEVSTAKEAYDYLMRDGSRRGTIATWSYREREMVAVLGGVRLITVRPFAIGKNLARRWRQATDPKIGATKLGTPRHPMSLYLDAIGYPTAALHETAEGSDGLLEHNRLSCFALRALCNKIAHDLSPQT